MDLQKAVNHPQAVLVDVREPLEFLLGHAKGAVNIPLGRIPSRLDEFRQMTTPIVLYCRSGARSGQALNFLRANGFKEAYNAGGLDEIRHLQRGK